MLDHHIQRTILLALAYADGIRFSDLKPDDIENKLFDYHLKKVLHAGYAQKSEDGLYRLTPEGKRIWKSILKKQASLTEQAYSLLFLVVRRSSDGAWLMYKRTAQPFLGLMGFIQAHPDPRKTISESSHEALITNTGLSGDFRPVSSGYLKIFKDGAVESFTHFTLLSTEDVSGDLVQNDEFGEYEWVHDPHFSNDTFLPTVATLADAYRRNDGTIIDATF